MSEAVQYIDAHAHLRSHAGAADELLTAMDRLDIEKTAVVAGGTITPELLSVHYAKGGGVDVDIDNDAVLSACRKTGGRLLPFFFANPHQGAEPYRAAAHDFHGLKLGPIVHGVPFSDPRMHALVATAATRKHPIYLHCLPRNGFAVEDLVTLAAAHPRSTFIMGHGGIGQADFHGITLVAPQPNIFFEVSGTFAATALVACKTLGADRVLFGSEYPLQDHRVELEKMRCLNLPAHDYRKIMRANMLSLLVPHLG